jgi:hypothetical protein
MDSSDSDDDLSSRELRRDRSLPAVISPFSQRAVWMQELLLRFEFDRVTKTTYCSCVNGNPSSGLRSSDLCVLLLTTDARIFCRTMNFAIHYTDLIRIAVLAAAILLLLAAVEFARRRFAIPGELLRKSVHILTGVFIAFAPPLFPRAGAVVLIAAVFVLFNALAYARGWLTSVHRTERRSYGTVYYPLSLLVLAALFWNDYPDLVTASIMVMAIGDAAAGIVGESIRRPRLSPSPPTANRSRAVLRC